MICQTCKQRPSTGIIFAMCDECFDAFERRISATPEGQSYVPTDAELATINDPFIDRSKS